MASNAEAAEIFRSIADLLDLLGERFKPEAYRRAARSIETLAEDLSEVAKRGELRTIPGVGEAIAEKIEEYLRTSQVPYYERLKREIPPGLVELMRLPGLGPKTARRFWVDLGIEGPTELGDAIAQGKLDHVKGFGPRKIEQIRTTLEQSRRAPAAGRMPIEEAYPVAERLVRALRKRSGSDRIEVAGSFRRRRETVGDLDILVTSDEPNEVFDAFSALPEVREIRMRGPTKETVLLTSGLQVDLRVVEPAAFGAALLYFTGSKDHNVHLRSLARDRGLKINEYGVFRGEDRIGGRSEEEVYAALGLPFIPAEIREDRGEIEAAQQDRVPKLVEAQQLTGDLHVHLPIEAKEPDVGRLVAEARRRKFGYVGLVIGGVTAAGKPFSLSPSVLAHIEGLRPKGIRIGRAVEAGNGPLPEAVRKLGGDYRVVRPTADLPEPKLSESSGPSVLLVAHLGGATGSSPERLRAWVDWANATHAAMEVGPGPERLDSTWARVAREAGVPLAVPTGLGGPRDDPTRDVALGFARRAAAEPKDVKNAAPTADVTARWSGGSR